MASARVQGYIQAILQNPEFLKTVASQYVNNAASHGDGETSGGLMHDARGNVIADVSMSQIARAIEDLETFLAEKLN